MQEYIDDIELEDWLLDYEYNESEENDFCSLILNNLGMIVGATVGGGVVGFVLGFIRFITHAGASTVLFSNIKWTAGIFAGLGFLLSLLFFYVLSSKENLNVSFKEIDNDEYEEELLGKETAKIVNDENIIVIDSASEAEEDNEEVEINMDNNDPEEKYEISYLKLWGMIHTCIKRIVQNHGFGFNVVKGYLVWFFYFVVVLLMNAIFDAIGLILLLTIIDFILFGMVDILFNLFLAIIYEFLETLLFGTIEIPKNTFSELFDNTEYEREIISKPSFGERLILSVFAVVSTTCIFSFF